MRGQEEPLVRNWRMKMVLLSAWTCRLTCAHHPSRLRANSALPYIPEARRPCPLPTLTSPPFSALRTPCRQIRHLSHYRRPTPS
ncbi:hypothetical protein B0H16DRAFT_1604729, partial [Mycena metata]